MRVEASAAEHEARVLGGTTQLGATWWAYEPAIPFGLLSVCGNSDARMCSDAFNTHLLDDKRCPDYEIQTLRGVLVSGPCDSDA